MSNQKHQQDLLWKRVKTLLSFMLVRIPELQDREILEKADNLLSKIIYVLLGHNREELVIKFVEARKTFYQQIALKKALTTEATEKDQRDLLVRIDTLLSIAITRIPILDDLVMLKEIDSLLSELVYIIKLPNQEESTRKVGKLSRVVSSSQQIERIDREDIPSNLREEENPLALTGEANKSPSLPRQIEQVDEEDQLSALMREATQSNDYHQARAQQDYGSDTYMKMLHNSKNSIPKNKLSTPNSRFEEEELLKKLESLEMQLLQAKEEFLDSYKQVKEEFEN